ncbi:sensor histidine kinase [Halarcobacter ebronensis]|uniref:histidine kinase n=1 Tax=Halarcobacter ebronensis TaxID=1462615 RepID=A0A4Q1AJC1_9BACT|nr:HAMP domain-containing sensor histidine kinase [Halarcobacter ebronensis]QKF81998.1 two-component system sensor histidine kinase [Halarcobacter ebronensis]RXK04289.1 hypothetical protein CRV07_10995 [Halarcobacter ebronensis]
MKSINTIFKNIIEYDEKAILILDNEYYVKYYNKSFANFFKQSKSVLSTKTKLTDDIFLIKLFSKQKSIQFFELLDSTMKSLKTNKKIFNFSFKKQEYFYLFTSSAILKKDTCEGIVLTINDITKSIFEKEEIKRQENVLIQESKMANLGKISGAISHQWRVPLNAISILLGNLIQFKHDGLLTDQIFEKNISYAMNNIEYLTNTINTFKTFYIPNIKIEEFLLHEALEQIISIINPYIKNSNIEIKILGDKTLKCKNYKNEFQQIIEILLLNSIDALKNIYKETPSSIKIYIKNIKKNFVISVEDNAEGIPLSIRDTIFSAFCSTKKSSANRGSGVGLYIAKTIAKRKLCGDLYIDSFSNPTIFSLEIPKKIDKND